eukprot:Skav223990  [mRNA]  locus=scaffold6785:46494:53610:+ [translate_table: standard]
MSSGLKVHIEQIQRRVDKVCAELADISDDIAALLEPKAFGDWVLVEEARLPFPEEVIRPFWNEARFHGLEDGPPGIPLECLSLAVDRIEGELGEVHQRATAAFRAGFWCQLALKTETHYKRLIEDGEDRKHWIILYRRWPSLHRRVTDIRSFQTALEVEHNCVWEGEMDKSGLKYAHAGDPNLLVWRIPSSYIEEQVEVQVFALPLLSRQGGSLFAIPEGALSQESVMDGLLQEDILGPSKEFVALLCVEDELGQVSDLTESASFLVIDLDDSVLVQMREYDPVTDSTEPIRPYDRDHADALPKVQTILGEVREWISQVASERMHFYSAQEDPEPVEEPPNPAVSKKPAVRKAPRVTTASLSEKVDALQAQIQLLLAAKASPQTVPVAPTSTELVGCAEVANGPVPGPLVAKVPPLSASLPCGIQPKHARSLLGPPPRTKNPQESNVSGAVSAQAPAGSFSAMPNAPADPMISALTQQSLALTQLVAHLAGGDPMTDLAASSSSASSMALNTKGVARRERMQNDLAARSSNYFGQVQAQLYRQLHPSKPIPKNPEDIAASGCSMTTYMERQGGYKNARDVGLAQWILAHAFDAAAEEDWHATREYIALLTTALEQSAMDGNWHVAYVLSLMEEPPLSVFAERMQQMTGTGRPFAPLVPAQWAAVALSYVKELDLLMTRKTEVSEEAKDLGLRHLSNKLAEDVCMKEFDRPSFSGVGLQNNGAGESCNFDADPKRTPGFEATSTDARSKSATVMSYPKWCAMLVSNVLKTRTPFACFLKDSLALSRGITSRTASTPTFFPVPVLDFDAVGRMPGKCSSSTRRRFHLNRVVHTVCMALNFWNSGGRWIDPSQLQRQPNAEHIALYRRIAALIRSDGWASSFEISKSGRKAPELLARLSELSILLTAQGSPACSYDRSFAGIPVNEETLNAPEVQPFSDLNASRLKLTGTGTWDATPFLDDDLVMAYREPKTLLGGLVLGPKPGIRDKPEEIGMLAKVWDANGLLYVHDQPRPRGTLTKVFNNFKSSTQDRQIGDRRGQNSLEKRTEGPSRMLPAGSDLMDVFMSPRSQKIVIAMSDRKDFYHQFWASKSRAISNTVGPPVHSSLLEDTSAYGAYMVSMATKKRRSRETSGDQLHHGDCGFPGAEMQDFEVLPPEHLWVSFKSVFQGDHAGVEIATQAHECLLQREGLLCPFTRLTSPVCLQSSVQAQGLVIDDFFALSVEQQSLPNGQSVAVHSYNKAQAAYSREKLLGSPEKDIKGENVGKVIGATVNSSQHALRRGLCTLGSPVSKRVSMSFITLALCQMSFTTDVLHLCLLGGWVAMLSFRRPLMSILQKSYHTVDANNVDHGRPKLVPLSRAVANELTLLAVLMPLALFDLGAEMHDKIFCTDASMKMGAICSATIPVRIAKALWKSSRSKGSYTKLESPVQHVLRQQDSYDVDYGGGLKGQIPERPLAFVFDFIEVFAGAALITSALVSSGLICGPPIELSLSDEYNMEWVHVISWLTYMVANGKLAAFMVSPPCTSFSIMRRPRLRSPMCPYGFNPAEDKTRLGNVLAHRAFQLMRVASMNGRTGILENPFSSYMRFLPGWKSLRALASAMEVRTDSCRFGSIHLKPFRFLGVNADLTSLRLRCACSGKHVKVQGSYTKASATYTPMLVDALAEVFRVAIAEVRKKAASLDDLSVHGLENQLVNEVAVSSEWKHEASWTFKKQSHINILEESAVLRLASSLARHRRPLRVVNLVDSYVVRGATCKGRTSSVGLSPILRRVNAMMVAAALYFSLPYVPTRWNASDDPTRGVCLRKASPSFHLEDWGEEDLYALANLPPLKKWASLWVRLCIRILGPTVLRFSNRSEYGHDANVMHPGFRFLQKSYDDTMGYPGEGPHQKDVTALDFQASSGIFFQLPFTLTCRCLHSHLSTFGISWLGSSLSFLLSLACFCFSRCLLLVFAVCCRFCCCWSCALLVFVLVGAPAEAMPIFPKTTGDRARAAARLARDPIPTGRFVLPQTTAKRQKLIDEFFKWAADEGLDVLDMFDHHQLYIDDINLILEVYGRQLYAAGKTYAHFAETINAITNWRPAIRRLLSGAWTFGFSWARHEPSEHHVAMPGSVALAIITSALMWGWLRFAGVFSLMWAGLLRPGELLAANRKDLLLPSDGDRTLPFGLLAIRDPKTRTSQARHQTAKLDMADMLQVIEISLSQLQAHQKLWPFSGSTLRQRFKTILKALDLPTQHDGSVRALELASVRAGSATWIMQTTESPDLLQRRGRWANRKMMDIYVQEISAVIYLQQIAPATKDKVLGIASAFPAVLLRAQQYVDASIPTSTWSSLFLT